MEQLFDYISKRIELTTEIKDFTKSISTIKKLKKGDVLIAISTSGNSENIIQAIKQANKSGISVISLTGETGGKMKDNSDILLNIPSNLTQRVQELHIVIGHIICEYVENKLFGKA